MGYYLSVGMIYGVAWKDGPPQRWEIGQDDDGEQPIEVGYPVYDDRLVWGEHGQTLSEPECHLAVCEAQSGAEHGEYARAAGTATAVQQHEWDTWITDYLISIGVPREKIPKPGWLALASFG